MVLTLGIKGKQKYDGFIEDARTWRLCMCRHLRCFSLSVVMSLSLSFPPSPSLYLSLSLFIHIELLFSLYSLIAVCLSLSQSSLSLSLSHLTALFYFAASHFTFLLFPLFQRYFYHCFCFILSL